MKVHELIAQLQEMNPNSDVVSTNRWDGCEAIVNAVQCWWQEDGLEGKIRIENDRPSPDFRPAVLIDVG